jgi:hypothetical protein
LTENPNWVFVFGDNTLRRGLGGAAKLRYHPQSYGFITKKFPSYTPDSFYTPEEYITVYKQEITKLLTRIQQEPTKHFLISKLGAGLANRHLIFEKVIEPNIKKDLAAENITFLWQ